MIPLTTLDQFASNVAGTQVTISCDAPSTFAPGITGYVMWVDGVVVKTIHLPTGTCLRLEHLNEPTPKPPSNIGTAVDLMDGHPANLAAGMDILTLTHEAEHISLNSTDESCVETAAVANVWSLLKQFKLAAWKTKQILWGAKSANLDTIPEYRKGCAS